MENAACRVTPPTTEDEVEVMTGRSEGTGKHSTLVMRPTEEVS
jgi:hypothetical protein